MLGRDTLWRQGSVLAGKDAHELGLVASLESDNRVVVISHDCDLPNESELIVELIVGMVITKVDPMFANARNPRCLHLRFSTPMGEETCIEIRHSDRREVSKESFAQLINIDGNFLIATDEKKALKQWLAARYGRPAFPNAFEKRLRKEIKKKKTVEYFIAKIIEPASSHLVGLFFDLGEDRATELPEEESYFLSISVVYDATEGCFIAKDAAEQTAENLTKLFYEAYGKPETLKEIVLENCAAVADTFFSLADLRKVDQWRLEYISLREDPADDFLPIGEFPS